MAPRIDRSIEPFDRRDLSVFLIGAFVFFLIVSIVSCACCKFGRRNRPKKGALKSEFDPTSASEKNVPIESGGNVVPSLHTEKSEKIAERTSPILNMNNDASVRLLAQKSASPKNQSPVPETLEYAASDDPAYLSLCELGSNDSGTKASLASPSPVSKSVAVTLALAAGKSPAEVQKKSAPDKILVSTPGKIPLEKYKTPLVQQQKPATKAKTPLEKSKAPLVIQQRSPAWATPTVPDKGLSVREVKLPMDQPAPIMITGQPTTGKVEKSVRMVRVAEPVQSRLV